MTHDELLENIDSSQFQNSRTSETAYYALRAVVIRHRPGLNEGEYHCNECFTEYPCRTIQDIEKELK